MDDELITTETRGRVGLITLNRPQQMNALNPQLMQELGKALYAFDADDALGAIVITGGESVPAAQVQRAFLAALNGLFAKVQPTDEYLKGA